MKKTLFLLLFAIGFSAASAQVNYYEGRDTLHINGEVYRIRYVEDIFIYFSNIKAPDNDRAYYLDGTPVPPREVSYTIENSADNSGLWKAARKTFTKEEIAALYNESVGVTYYVLPDGTIIYVKFSLSQKSVFHSIPPERWAVWEKKIKQYKKFQLNGAEKYQYVVPGGRVYFKDIYNE